MKLQEIFSASQQALANNLLRTSLTMLGIIIGISSVILITSIGQGAVAFITQELSVFGASNLRIVPGEDAFSQFAATSDPLTTEDARAIQNARLPNVQLIAPLAIANGRVSTLEENTLTTIRGVPPEVQQILEPTIVYGSFISETNNNNRDKVALLGYQLAEELFGKDTNPVGESIRVDNDRYRVIGVTRATSGLSGVIFNSNVLVPINSLISHVTGTDELFQIVVRVEDDRLIRETMTEIEQVLRDHRSLRGDQDSDFFIDSFEETLSTVQTVTGLLTLMIAAISGISLVVGGVGVMNIMLVSVTERTREIGLLKSIGAKEADILSQFLVESITLTVAGGVVGIALGLLGALAISQVIGIPFVISYVSVFLAVAVSALVGLVFGLYPARRASRLDPIVALKYE